MQHPTSATPITSLIEQGAAALRAGERARACDLLAAALRADSTSARAWLWLAGALSDPAEQRYCLERALDLEPQLAAARRGLEALPPALPRAPAAIFASRSQEFPELLIAPSPHPPSPPSPHLPAALAPADLNPWRWVWVRPRAAMAAAIRGRSLLETGMLGALAGASALLAWAAGRNLGDELRPAELLALALLGGMPLGLAALVLGGVLLRSGGRWLGGRGGAGAVRAALAWAAVPLVLGLPLWLIQLVALPLASFGSAAPPATQAILALLCGGVHLGLALWAAFLSLIGLSVAHDIPRWRAALAWALAALTVVAVIAGTVVGSAILITLRQS